MIYDLEIGFFKLGSFFKDLNPVLKFKLKNLVILFILSVRFREFMVLIIYIIFTDFERRVKINYNKVYN